MATAIAPGAVSAATPRAALLDDLAIACAVDARMCRTSFYRFFLRAFRELEGADLQPCWYIEYLCSVAQAEIERIVSGREKYTPEYARQTGQPWGGDIIINVPPRTLKSRIFATCLPAWAWMVAPNLKFITSSHSLSLSMRHTDECRTLVTSDWYSGIMPDFGLSSTLNTKQWLQNVKNGAIRAISVDSRIYGIGADVILADDLCDPIETSELGLQAAREHWQILGTRLNNPRIGVMFCIQQRVHERDITGWLLDTAKPGLYRHICLPSELTDEVRPGHLSRFYAGGLLNPARYPRDALDVMRGPTRLGEYGYAAQFLQRPAPAGGGMFPRWAWGYWVPRGGYKRAPGERAERSGEWPEIVYKDAAGNPKIAKIVELPAQMDQVIDSWDMGSGGTSKDNDPTVGQKWGRRGAQKYLLDEISGPMDYPAAKKAIRRLRWQDRRTSSVVVERAAAGPAVVADLEAEIPGIISISAGPLSKAERARVGDAQGYVSQVMAGQIFLPHPAIAPWVHVWIEEHANFPVGKHDDRVDAASQAVSRMSLYRYVLPSFRPDEHGEAYRVGLVSGETHNYGAVWLDGSGRLWGVMAYWAIRERMLRVYGELRGIRSVPDAANGLWQGMRMAGHAPRAVLGNPEMSAGDYEHRCPARVLSGELQAIYDRERYTAGVSVREPYQYDRPGAIGLLDLMFSRGQVKIHPVCVELQRQIGAWVVDKDKPAPGAFLAEALAMIGGEVARDEKLRDAVPKPPDGYRPIEYKGIKPPESLEEKRNKRPKNYWQKV